MNRKTFSGVLNNNIAPTSPPANDGNASVQTRERFSASFCRYAQELITEPGQMAQLLVAFAVIDDMPL